MSEEKQEQVTEKSFEVGDLGVAIGNSAIDVIKLIKDPNYKNMVKFGAVPGRISRVINEDFMDDKEQKQSAKFYIFTPFNQKGEVMIDPKSGQPVHVELPAESLFTTANAATEYLTGHLDEAMAAAKTMANNTAVDAEKILNQNRKVKVPGIIK